MHDNGFIRRFTEALRPGAYLRIVGGGLVGAGDGIRVVERPGHGVSIRDVFRIYARDHDEAERLLRVPGLSESWKAWAESVHRTERGSARDPGCC
jgi:MOSC domain-containing protein YiiM